MSNGLLGGYQPLALASKEQIEIVQISRSELAVMRFPTDRQTMDIDQKKLGQLPI